MEKWARLLYQPALPLYAGKRVTASDEHIDIAKRAAVEGMVLLKNSESALPLDVTEKAVLFGKASVEYVKGGGGSGDVFCEYVRSLYDGLKLHGVNVYEPLVDFYKEELKKQYEEGYIPGMTKEPVVPEAILKGAADFSDTVIVVLNRYSAEGWDRCSIECNRQLC